MFIPRDFKTELEEYLSTIERDLAATEAQAESYRKEKTRVGSLLAAIRSTEEEATTPSGGPTREQLRTMFSPGDLTVGTRVTITSDGASYLRTA